MSIYSKKAAILQYFPLLGENGEPTRIFHVLKRYGDQDETTVWR